MRRTGQRPRPHRLHLVAAGAPVWMLGIAENVEIIRRIGGRAKDLKVTFAAAGDRGVNVEGCGRPADAVRGRAGRARRGHPGVRAGLPRGAARPGARVHRVHPARRRRRLKDVLDEELEKLLAGPAADAASGWSPSCRPRCLSTSARRTASRSRSATARPAPVPSLELDDILRAARVPSAPASVSRRCAAGTIYLNADDAGRRYSGARGPTSGWKPTCPSTRRRFFLMDGDWFEIGADYVRASRDAIAPLFPPRRALTCRPGRCREGATESDYNQLRRGQVRRTDCCAWTGTRRSATRSGFAAALEICDLLGPDNELIHVKRAKGSAPLSHLFSQGLISAQSLIAGPAEVREQFVESVARCPMAGPCRLTSSRPRSCTRSCWRTARNSPPTRCSRSPRRRWRTLPGS